MAKYGKFKFATRRYGTEKWIFDRNQGDVDADDDRVYINYWDLNRIETRTRELIDAVPDDNQYKWMAEGMMTKTDWEKVTSSNYSSNMPTAAQTDRIINNIRTLWLYPYKMQSGLYASHYSKIPVTMDNIDIHGLNNIELALYYMYLHGVGHDGATVTVTYNFKLEAEGQYPHAKIYTTSTIISASAKSDSGIALECKYSTKPRTFETTDLSAKMIIYYNQGAIEVSIAQAGIAGSYQFNLPAVPGTYTQDFHINLT